MTRHYETLLQEEREGYTVIVDKTYEDLDPADCFDTSIDPDTGRPYFDMDEIYSDINSGNLDWFMLRARVFYEGIELGSDYVGGFLYKDAREVLTDGTAEDMIYTAMAEAKKEALRLKRVFQDLVI